MLTVGHVGSALLLLAKGRDAGPDGFRDLHRAFNGLARQQHRELLTAVACGEVRARPGRDAFGDGRQRGLAGLMPVGVIESLDSRPQILEKLNVAVRPSTSSSLVETPFDRAMRFVMPCPSGPPVRSSPCFFLATSS